MNLHRSVLDPKYYTVKEWKKFDKYTDDYIIVDNEKYYLTMQEILCQKYDVRLTDHKTKKEKLFAVIDKFNAKNLNAGITKFNHGVDEFVKVTKSNNKSKGPSLKGLYSGMSQKEYDSILGPKRRSKKNISFWDEDHKTRKRRNKRAKAVQKEKHMPFYGSKKVKFF